MQALGRHILVECYDCDVDVLNDTDLVEGRMEEAARRAGATIVGSSFHNFNPHGVSGVVIIAESHLAIHTWPEYGYAAVDLFTCGESCDPWDAMDYLREAFKAERVVPMEVHRGAPETNGQPLTHKPLGAAHGEPVSASR